MPLRCAHQLDVQSFRPRRGRGRGAGRPSADDYDVGAGLRLDARQYWGTHRSAPYSWVGSCENPT